jgi:hypothetical protein
MQNNIYGKIKLEQVERLKNNNLPVYALTDVDKELLDSLKNEGWVVIKNQQKDGKKSLLILCVLKVTSFASTVITI